MSAPYPWQSAQWRLVAKLLEQQRLPHALLCWGTEGLGKINFADCLAKTLLCGQAETKACGQCKSCQLFEIGAHPDFYQISPEQKHTNIKVDQIRELTANISQTSQLHGYQVAVIAPAQCMNISSANALLKTLEEPPGAVLILLVANQVQGIPATILSRCQQIQFSAPETHSTLPWLQKALSLDAATAGSLLRLAKNAPLKALEMGRNNYKALRNQVFNALWQLFKRKCVATSVATQLLKEDLLMILEIIYSLALDLLRVKVKLPTASLENQDLSEKYNALSQHVSQIRLAKYVPDILKVRSALLTTNSLNPQLILESLLIKWQRLGEKKC